MNCRRIGLGFGARTHHFQVEARWPKTTRFSRQGSRHGLCRSRMEMTGLEPVTPACKLEPGKSSKSAIFRDPISISSRQLSVRYRWDPLVPLVTGMIGHGHGGHSEEEAPAETRTGCGLLVHHSNMTHLRLDSPGRHPCVCRWVSRTICTCQQRRYVFVLATWPTPCSSADRRIRTRRMLLTSSSPTLLMNTFRRNGADSEFASYYGEKVGIR